MDLQPVEQKEQEVSEGQNKLDVDDALRDLLGGLNNEDDISPSSIPLLSTPTRPDRRTESKLDTSARPTGNVEPTKDTFNGSESKPVQETLRVETGSVVPPATAGPAIPPLTPPDTARGDLEVKVLQEAKESIKDLTTTNRTLESAVQSLVTMIQAAQTSSKDVRPLYTSDPQTESLCRETGLSSVYDALLAFRVPQAAPRHDTRTPSAPIEGASVQAALFKLSEVRLLTEWYSPRLIADVKYRPTR